MKQEKKIRLYGPHPGVGGAILPLPKPMKRIADSLDGKIMGLEDALKKIKEVAEQIGGTICWGGGYISFTFSEINKREHGYKLISYEEIKQ